MYVLKTLIYFRNKNDEPINTEESDIEESEPSENEEEIASNQDPSENEGEIGSNQDRQINLHASTSDTGPNNKHCFCSELPIGIYFILVTCI